MSGIIWILSIFWAAVPLMGWGVYDFEPMRTCCTLDYTRGDRCSHSLLFSSPSVFFFHLNQFSTWCWRTVTLSRDAFLFNRDYVTYMLTLVALYLTFPAITMFSCYDSIHKHFKKIHHHRVNVLQESQMIIFSAILQPIDLCLASKQALKLTRTFFPTPDTFLSTLYHIETLVLIFLAWF